MFVGVVLVFVVMLGVVCVKFLGGVMGGVLIENF